MFTLSELMAIFPDHLWLDVSQDEQEHTWQIVTKQSYSNAAARWNGYLNTLCLNRVLAWLQAEFEDCQLHPEADITLWDVVNGTALTLGNTRIVLIPNDQSNLCEFCVPQEWVEIPTWTPDYYLAVQINLDEGWLRVWSYATQAQIRQRARYEATDRTYCLNPEALIRNVHMLWVAQEWSLPQKSAVRLSSNEFPTQVDRVLNQLSQTLAYSPRLDVPFTQWAAILASDTYRHQLYDRRRQNKTEHQAEAIVAVASTNLSLWCQHDFSAGWQALAAPFVFKEREVAYRLRNHSRFDNEIKIGGFKIIDLGVQLGEQSVMLLVGLTTETNDKVCIRVRLCLSQGEARLPANINLMLLDVSGTVLQAVRSRSHDRYIQLKRFKPAQGTRFKIQVALGAVTIEESFVLDPIDA